MTEQELALMEAHRNEASTAYFLPRPAETLGSRKMFEAGFDAAWKMMQPTVTHTHHEWRIRLRDRYLDAMHQEIQSIQEQHRKENEEALQQILKLRELLRRGERQLSMWQEKYGEHNPEWLPPGGDLRWMEDVSDHLTTVAPAPTFELPKTRSDVYKSIDSERDYQDRKWGTVEQHPHEVGGWLTLMRKLLADAETAWSGSNGDYKALLDLRKVLAVGVACAEQHGLPGRSYRQPVEKMRA